MVRGGPLPSRAEFLYVAARARSPTTDHIFGMADAPVAGWIGRRCFICSSGYVGSNGADLYLCPVWRGGCRRSHVLWSKSGGAGDRVTGGCQDR